MVLIDDLNLSTHGASCPGEPQGGLRAGTRVTVRRKGPFNVVSLQAFIANRDLPLRELTPSELATNDWSKCAD